MPPETNSLLNLSPEQKSQAQLQILDKMRGEIQALCANLAESDYLRDAYLSNIDNAKKAVVAGDSKTMYEFLAVYRGVIIMAYNFHAIKCYRLALVTLTHGLACFTVDLALKLDRDFTGSAVEIGDQYGLGKAHISGT